MLDLAARWACPDASVTLDNIHRFADPDYADLNDSRALVTHDGERIGIGDRVATRRNASEFGVANRDIWSVTA